MVSGHGSRDRAQVSGGHGGGEIPVPIPNTAVKPTRADGTWRFPPGRVGRRRDFLKTPTARWGFSLFVIDCIRGATAAVGVRSSARPCGFQRSVDVMIKVNNVQWHMKFFTRKILLATALVAAPIVGVASSAGASNPTWITTCSISPNSGTLAPGQSFDFTFTADGNGTWGQIIANGTTVLNTTAPIGQTGPISISFNEFSSYLNGQAGTVTWNLLPTDGTVATSQTPLCSLSLTLAAAPPTTLATTTTTTAPVTLPHTGSNSSGYLIAGGAGVALGGLFLVSAARRRRA